MILTIEFCSLRQSITGNWASRTTETAIFSGFGVIYNIKFISSYQAFGLDADCPSYQFNGVVILVRSRDSITSCLFCYCLLQTSKGLYSSQFAPAVRQRQHNHFGIARTHEKAIRRDLVGACDL